MKHARRFANFALAVTLLGIVGLLALSVFDPGGTSQKSPYYFEPGPVTVFVASLLPKSLEEETLPNIFRKLSRWPVWVSSEDKQHLSQGVSALKSFDLEKMKAAITLLAMSAHKEKADLKELAPRVVFELVAKNLTPKLVIVLMIFCLAGAFTLVLLLRVMDNIWFNPFRIVGSTVRTLFKTAGTALSMILKIAFFSSALLTVGMAIQSQPGLFFGFTELSLWLSIFLFILWCVSVAVKQDISIPAPDTPEGRAVRDDTRLLKIDPTTTNSQPDGPTPTPLPMPDNPAWPGREKGKQKNYDYLEP